MNIGAHLARFEWALKEGAIRDVDTFQQWHDWLEGLHSSLDMSDPNQGRAYRLLEEVDWPESVYSKDAAHSVGEASGLDVSDDNDGINFEDHFGKYGEI